MIELITDRKLPGLATALNDDEMRLLFSSSLRRTPDFGQITPLQVRHQVLKYTPGKRCVIEYRLHTKNEGSPPLRLIGKMYRKDRGRIIFENLRHLWEISHRNGVAGKSLGMPEPLAYLPEIGMVLQSAVPGRQLSDFSPQDDLPEAIRHVAENLAVLHGLPVAAGEKRTIADHLAKYCHSGLEALMAALPESAPLVEGIVAALAEESLQRAPLCPIHGDLGLAQIFIAENRAYFIDFDGFGLSHAALDLGNFLVTLQVHFGSKSSELAQVFLESYLANQPPQFLTGLRAYQAFACLRRAVICFRLKTGAGWHGQILQLLETGNAFLSES
ncbi:MAG: aminoglycoside phosphotransferase family protein [candidate division KSB1 bacterium]|nr:aminoglycoside phosphotransferase family protein [candidate division KSB1 bacterium]MDZ7302407.1 aminoglycoside phosphotransferase family protein [candidate division KSB1 bacterium]MDZ7311609.1 aminoglycoside phosphotransferase family protein [candidate division KSB1 bacterium]